jgi:hypothetical protein
MRRIELIARLSARSSALRILSDEVATDVPPEAEESVRHRLQEIGSQIDALREHLQVNDVFFRDDAPRPMYRLETEER